MTIGNTTYATSITVAVFMGGLALGAFLVRKKADGIENKLRLYGSIEFLISVFALLSPLLLKSMDYMYIAVFQKFSPSPAVMLFVQIIFSSILLLIPTVLMGLTLPLLSSWLVRKVRFIGFRAGTLYSFNTFGALFGASISGFFLIRLFGVYNTLYVAVILNFAIAIAAFILSYHDKEHIGEIEIRKDEELSEPKTGYLQLLITSCVFVIGFVSLGYEIIWMRTIIHYLQAEIYVFSAVLCVYLLGYASGVFIGSRLAKRILNCHGVFGIVFQLVGISGILYIPFLVSIVESDFIMGPFATYLYGFNGYVICLFYSLILFLVPSILMGICFPFLVQMMRKRALKAGDTVARAYGINTIGSVLGTLCAGFVFIPLVGSQASIQLFGAISLFMGFAVIFVYGGRLLKTISAGLALVGAITIIITPGNAYLEMINIPQSRATGQKVTLIDALEGVTTTATVHHYRKDNRKAIATGGMNVAGDFVEHRQTQKVQAHIPVILHGNPRDVLTVGFGAGELTNLLTYHNIPNITCAELSEEMVVLAKKHFSHINLGDSLEERVNMIYMDAKNYVHLTDSKYDIILNDCIWPGQFAESSSLYTEEYFLDGLELLKENGIYSTWLPISIPRLSLMSIIKTFSSVFENTILIYPHFYLSQHALLIGQKAPHKYSYIDMEKQYNKEAVANSLKMIGISDINDIIDFMLTDWKSLENLAKSYPINSDDFPVVEFDVDRRRIALDENFILKQFLFLSINTTRVNFDDIIGFEGISEDGKDDILEGLYRSQKANFYLFRSYVPAPKNRAHDLIVRGLGIDPGNSDLLRRKKILEGHEGQ